MIQYGKDDDTRSILLNDNEPFYHLESVPYFLKNKAIYDHLCITIH
jgi:hypothetical protein